MKAGDDVIVTGTLIKRWKKASKDSRPEVSLCIIANNLHIKNYKKSKEQLSLYLSSDYLSINQTTKSMIDRKLLRVR